MIEIAPFESLVFIFEHGCEACEAAMPELEKFERENPRLMVIKIQASGPHVETLTGLRKIEATPTYVFRRGTDGFRMIGAMTAKQIGKWLDRVSSEA